MLLLEILPLLAPQVTLLKIPTVQANAEGCVTIAEQTVVQPFESVTVTVYVPAERPFSLALIPPFDHK